MNAVVRSILALIGGMLVAFVVIAVIEAIGMRLYPPPAGAMPTDRESLKTLVASMPLAAKLCMLVVYAAGSVAGGRVAARFAPRARMMHAMIVAALLFGAGLMNLMTIPHPAWFWIASSVIYWLGAWSGGQAAGAQRGAGGMMLPLRDVLGCAAAGLVLAGTLVAMVNAASAGSIPDSVQMSDLRLAAAKAPVLLVYGDFGLRELRKPLLDSTGVRSATWKASAHARPAIVSTADAPHAVPPSPITWNEISSLETQHQQKTKWTLLGGITGLALGALIYGTSDATGETGEIPPGAAWLLAGPMAGAAAGFVVGSMTGKRTIYPQPSQENP